MSNTRWQGKRERDAMNISLVEKLTFACVQKQGRYAFFATAATVLLITISVFWMLFRIGGTRVNILFSDIAYAATAFIGAIWIFYVVYNLFKGPLRVEKRFRLGWLLIGLGSVSSGIGGTYYTYLEYMRQSPFPSFSDIFFNLFYPLVGIGLILLPTTLRFRARTALDAGITTLSVIGVSWFFLIGPLYFAQRDQAPMLELVTALSYPTWDIFLVLAIVLLILLRADPILHASLLLFAIGILADIWADSAYAYFNVFGSYQTGTFYIDPFWIVGFLFVGLSALYQYNTLVRKAYQEHTPHLQATPPPRAEQHLLQVPSSDLWNNLQSGLISVPILFLLGLSAYAVIATHNPAGRGLMLITACVGILVVIRYHVATRQNTILLRERQQQHSNSEKLRRLSTQFMAIIELEPLCEHIVIAAITTLGFDAALLLLRNAPHGTAHRQGLVSLYAALASSSSSPPAIEKWSLPEEHRLPRLALSGQELAVTWDNSLDIGHELQLWPHTANTTQPPVLLFFPLRYQGEVLGSLGVISHRSSALKLETTEHQLLQAYTEQSATFIEHASMYQEKHEHEMFARGLANLAARLNTAMVEPTGVHQIICQEASYAFQADYAILYIPGPNNDLTPIALHTSTHEPPTTVAYWPPITGREPEAQALLSPHPMVLQLPLQPGKTTKKLPAISGSLLPETRAASQTHPPTAITLRNQHAQTLHEKLERCLVHTALLIPLLAKGKPIALLVLARSYLQDNGEKNAFDATNITHAQDFAEQAAVALSNAQLYQELHDAHQRLQEVDRLKDQFMITASHELRTPLTAVQGYLELLSQFDGMLPPEQKREFLHNASRGCDELVIMLNNIMDTSRLEVDAGIKPALLQQISVHKVVEAVIDLIKPQVVQEHREVHTAIPPHLTMRADPIRLRQVLLNLATNALKYSPPTTPLYFNAQTAAHSPRETVLCISDRGKGIAPAEQTRLFQRFVRLERDINSPVRGSGLGLYISRRLTEAMGGKIWVESTGIPGEGSTFYIQLPAA
jgi:signal transduction histidine kinase